MSMVIATAMVMAMATRVIMMRRMALMMITMLRMRLAVLMLVRIVATAARPARIRLVVQPLRGLAALTAQSRAQRRGDR